MCLWRVGVHYYLFLCRKLPHRVLWQRKLCKEFLAVARYGFYFQWAKWNTLPPMFVNVSPLRGKTKLVVTFLAQCVSLVNIHLLSTHSVLDPGGLVEQ